MKERYTMNLKKLVLPATVSAFIITSSVFAFAAPADQAKHPEKETVKNEQSIKNDKKDIYLKYHEKLNKLVENGIITAKQEKEIIKKVLISEKDSKEDLKDILKDLVKSEVLNQEQADQVWDVLKVEKGDSKKDDSRKDDSRKDNFKKDDSKKDDSRKDNLKKDDSKKDGPKKDIGNE
jgi:hypothetical protein